ncbi:Acetone carboxylase gamma subunit [Solimonas aquatica]|uniref:Acetone carboxylase gamma subunit n=1 Tax=Solimonas aquatica TaxID=489703 RepID=A0A1H9FJX7_9GAMM|nr:acetone carboxylase subunit gamma [Solimonas aquatica]SEQ38232.1 Acetone carboxylase gamma subunit [Solimonas aquatica]
MRVLITENLRIDLDSELWECRHCGKALISARENYKRGLLVYNRDPREIHKPLLDPAKYALTYSPNPDWCRILEYYCPRCGSMIETEYLPPGHPPVHDIQLDIDALKAQWRDRAEVREHAPGADAGLDKLLSQRAVHARTHSH